MENKRTGPKNLYDEKGKIRPEILVWGLIKTAPSIIYILLLPMMVVWVFALGMFLGDSCNHGHTSSSVCYFAEAMLFSGRIIFFSGILLSIISFFPVRRSIVFQKIIAIHLSLYALWWLVWGFKIIGILFF